MLQPRETLSPACLCSDVGKLSEMRGSPVYRWKEGKFTHIQKGDKHRNQGKFTRWMPAVACPGEGGASWIPRSAHRGASSPFLPTPQVQKLSCLSLFLHL